MPRRADFPRPANGPQGRGIGHQQNNRPLAESINVKISALRSGNSLPRDAAIPCRRFNPALTHQNPMGQRQKKNQPQRAADLRSAGPDSPKAQSARAREPLCGLGRLRASAAGGGVGFRSDGRLWLRQLRRRQLCVRQPALGRRPDRRSRRLGLHDQPMLQLASAHLALLSAGLPTLRSQAVGAII